MHTVPRLASSDFRAGDGAPVICDDAEYRCFVPDEMADLCPIIYSVKATSKKNSACSQQLLSTAACHHDGKKSDCYVNDNFAVPAWRFVRPLPPAWYRVVYERKRGASPKYGVVPVELLEVGRVARCGAGALQGAQGRWPAPHVVARRTLSFGVASASAAAVRAGAVGARAIDARIPPRVRRP